VALELNAPASANKDTGKTSGSATRQTSIKKQASLAGLLGRRAKIAVKDRLFFTEQLALLLDSGMPTHSALQLVARQTANPMLAAAIGQIANDVLGGSSLSAAMQKHPGVFSISYTRLVEASEGGGYLSKVLVQLQRADERNQALRNTLVSAFTYPVILLVFSAAVVVFVLVYVFPKFSKLFAGLGDDLPATTRVLMSISDLLINHWMLTLMVLAALIAGFEAWRNSAGGRALFDLAKLRLPGIRTIYQRFYMSQVMRVMGLSISNGVSVVDTLESCRETVTNEQLRAEYATLGQRVQEGGRLSDAFRQLDSVPQLAKEMITTAEESGNLGPVATRIASYYEEELNRLLEGFSKIAEPVMLIVMGAVVGLIVSSLLLPVFKLSQTIH
jgi:type II secretory pathway component PulF